MLTARDPRRVLTHQAAETERPVAFMFGGVGDQYPAMARELYDSEPVFREALDTCFTSVQREHGLDLKQVLFDAAAERSDAAGTTCARCSAGAAQHASRLHDTDVAQPLVFAIEYALAQLLMRWGVQPRAMVGYSLGEYVAACVAGVLSLRGRPEPGCQTRAFDPVGARGRNAGRHAVGRGREATAVGLGVARDRQRTSHLRAGGNRGRDRVRAGATHA